METVFSNKVLCNLSGVDIILFVNICNNWDEEIYQKPTLRTYIAFKSTFEPEPYVFSYMLSSQWSLYAQLRIRVLTLKLETGRYNNVNIQECVSVLKMKHTVFAFAQCTLKLEMKYFNESYRI